MSKIVGVVALVVACLACSVAEAVPRRVTIVRRQRIVQAPIVRERVVFERPLELRTFAVPLEVQRQQLFFFGF